MLGWKTAMLRVVEVLSFCSIRMAAQGWFLEGFGKTLRNSAICCGELVLTPAWYYRWLLGWGIWSRLRLPTHFCRQGRHSEATGGKFVFTRMPKQQNVEGHDKDISKERSGWHWNVIITSRMLLDIIFCTMYLAANPVWSWLIRSLIYSALYSCKASTLVTSFHLAAMQPMTNHREIVSPCLQVPAWYSKHFLNVLHNIVPVYHCLPIWESRRLKESCSEF